MQENIVKINDFISLLNINLDIDETKRLLDLLMPLNELLTSNPSNSLFFYFSGTKFHAESYIKVDDQFGSVHVEDFELKALIQKLIPSVIRSTSKANLFPKLKQLET